MVSSARRVHHLDVHGSLQYDAVVHERACNSTVTAMLRLMSGLLKRRMQPN